MVGVARHAAKSGRRSTFIILAVVLVAAAAGVAGGVVIYRHGRPHGPSSSLLVSGRPRATSLPTTTAPTTTTTTTTSTLPPPAPGFVAGHVTAVGDSVMLDYQTPLQADVPGIDVEASVSRQWDTGVSILQQLKTAGQLGAEVVVALSTNGPISDADFDQMMGVLQGASRVVFVNVHVDKPWQDPNNQVLAAGAARYPNVVIADWATMAAQNPSWFGSDGTHLAIDGAGTTELASLIASKLSVG
jgi:hypothetical protein